MRRLQAGAVGLYLSSFPLSSLEQPWVWLLHAGEERGIEKVEWKTIQGRKLQTVQKSAFLHR